MSDQASAARGERLLAALTQESSDARLQAALTAGTHPDPAFVGPLVHRSGVEPDFYVRDMLSWALVRHPTELVLPRLRAELGSSNPQARSQGLHTLSKIGAAHTRAWITRDHLHDPDDEVARAAWRTAVGLAPETETEERARLAEELLAELGRGEPQVQRSLSRALVELGDTVEAPLQRLSIRLEGPAGAHAAATLRLLHDPESSFFLGPA